MTNWHLNDFVIILLVCAFWLGAETWNWLCDVADKLMERFYRD